MCGLFGWQWAPKLRPSKQQRHRLAQALAVANDRRGGQAWGIWSPSCIIRGLGKAADNTHRFSNLSSVFGHSRYATHGSNTLDNAHPFSKDGMALSHNGVISNHRELNRKFNRDFEVDSQHLLAHMLEKKDFKDIEAYGAITWAKSSTPNHIYMGRLNQRGQLSVMKTAIGVVWSSEEDALRAALKDAGLPVEINYIIDPGKVYYAEDGKLYVDESHPSIEVTTVASTPSWESYGDWSNWRYRSSSHSTLGGTYFGGYWCNKHLDFFSGCPCPASERNQPHVVSIPVGLSPKKGDTVPSATSKPTPPSAPTPPSRRHVRAVALEAYTPKPTPPAAAAPRPEWQKYLAEWDAYQAEMQAQADAEEEARWKEEVIADLAVAYLSEKIGLGSGAFDGVTTDQIIDMAIEEGFDPEAEWLRLAEEDAEDELNIQIDEVPPTEGTPHVAGSKEAGVRTSEGRNEPTDGRKAQAVVGG